MWNGSKVRLLFHFPREALQFMKFRFHRSPSVQKRKRKGTWSILQKYTTKWLESVFHRTTSAIKSNIFFAKSALVVGVNVLKCFRVRYMQAISQVCDAHLTDKFEIGGNLDDKEITETLKTFAPTLNETMLLCKFRNKLEFCNKFFEEIVTDEGHCFTFNMLNSRELYREGYVCCVLITFNYFVLTKHSHILL